MYLLIGSGYVGERVADLLARQGHEVVAVTHSPESAQRLAAQKPYAVHAADVSDRASLEALASRLGQAPAGIVHCASSSRGGAEMYQRVYVEGMRRLLAAFPGSPVLFTSSTSVYPQTDGSVVTEESDAQPDRETSRLLREAEELALAAGGAVARLAGIYGPGRSFVLKSFLEGTAVIEGNEGFGRYLNQIHREDAASGLAHVLTVAKMGIYNVVDSAPMTQRECFLHLAMQFQRPLPPAAPPNTARKRAWTHKRISNAKLRQSGWAPIYPSYFDALERDVDLTPSVLAQVANRAEAT